MLRKYTYLQVYIIFVLIFIVFYGFDFMESIT